MNHAASPIPVASPTAEPAVPQESELLRIFLAGRNVPCPKCEYNLRDLVGDRCPECGDQLSLRVNMTEPRLAAMITGLVGLSVGTGFSAIVVIFSALMALFRPQDGIDKGPLIFCCVIAIIGGALMWIWLGTRRRLRRQRGSLQWFLAALCWGLPVVVLLCLMLLVN